MFLAYEFTHLTSNPFIYDLPIVNKYDIFMYLPRLPIAMKTAHASLINYLKVNYSLGYQPPLKQWVLI